MVELIKVEEKNVGGEVKQAISGRLLHSFLGATERYSQWFERQLQFGFVENVDYFGCEEFNTLANQTLMDHIITMDMAKSIAMVQRSDKGKQARDYFISVEKKYKQQQQLVALPSDYLSALKALVASEEEKAKAIELTKKQDALITNVLAPKAEIYDRCMDSDTHFDMSQAAKLLNYKGVGRNKMFELLRAIGLLNTKNEPYQQFVTAGYFKVIEVPVQISGKTEVKIKTLVTQRGIEYINKKLGEIMGE